MSLVPPAIARLRPYEAGRSIDDVKRQFGLTRVIKLASNENPLGASPRAVDAIAAACGDLNRYPNGGMDLRRAVAAQFGVRVENTCVGAGSEGIMSNIIRTFLADDEEVLTSEGTFVGIRVLTEGRGVRFRTVPMRNWGFDLEALADAIGPRTKIVYLANPNNPTGSIFTRAEFERFHARVPAHVLIILDEAYFEFAASEPSYPDSLHYRHDNVITLRTFSKAHGLAGLRVGYGFAHADLIESINKIKLPFEPSGLAQAGAVAALDDHAFLTETLTANAQGRERLASGLRELGYHPLPTYANFVLVPLASADEAKSLFEDLLAQGIIVRHVAAFGLPQCVRISIGTEAEIEECLKCLRQVRSPIAQ